MWKAAEFGALFKDEVLAQFIHSLLTWLSRLSDSMLHCFIDSAMDSLFMDTLVHWLHSLIGSFVDSLSHGFTH